MKKIISNCFLLMIFALINLNAQSLSENEFMDYLISDEYYDPIFSADLTFEIYSPNREKSVATFSMYENKGKSIVKYKSPPKEKGKIILQLDSKYWMYFPKTRASSVLSPLSALVGNASNSDVLREPDSRLYNVKLIDHPDPRGDRTILFEAKSRKAPYGRVITHYDGYKKLFSEIYSRSDILLKTVEFSEHIPGSRAQKGFLPLFSKIQDARNSKKYTIMKFSNVQALNSINENWFNPNNLGRVR